VQEPNQERVVSVYAELIKICGSFAVLMFVVMLARPAVQSVLGEAWGARNFGYTVHESYRLSRDGSAGGRIRMPLVARILSQAEKLGRHTRARGIFRAIRVEPLDHPVKKDPRFLLAWPSFRVPPVTQTVIVAASAMQFAAALSRMADAAGRRTGPRQDPAPAPVPEPVIPAEELRPLPAPVPVVTVDGPPPGEEGKTVITFKPGNYEYDDKPEFSYPDPIWAAEPAPAGDFDPVSDWDNLLAAARA
jgi:hypothetical protein